LNNRQQEWNTVATLREALQRRGEVSVATCPGNTFSRLAAAVRQVAKPAKAK